MAQTLLDQLLAAFRNGSSDFRQRSNETVCQVADSLNKILEEAATEGQKIRKTLVRNWSSLGRPRRRRPVPVLLGLLGLGAAAAYLVRRASATARG